MKEENKFEIINTFRQLEGYLSLSTLQHIIPEITYLFWKTKYPLNINFKNITSILQVETYLNYANVQDTELKNRVFNEVKKYINDRKIIKVLYFLNKKTEDELYEIVMCNYVENSRADNSTRIDACNFSQMILEKTKGKRVLDICSYTGNFLMEYAKKNREYEYTGIDIDKESNLIAQIRLRMLNVKNKIMNEDALFYDYNQAYDKIFCECDFSGRVEPDQVDRLNKISKISNFIFSTRSSLEWGCVNSVINAMSKDGKAIVFLKDYTMYKSQDEEFRKKLIENKLVEGSILMPKFSLLSTSLPVVILILSHNNENVRFVDAREMIDVNERKMKIDYERIYEEYSSSENTENAKTISIDEIRKNEHILIASNYTKDLTEDDYSGEIIEEISKDVFKGCKTVVISHFDSKAGKNGYKIINMCDVVDGEINKNIEEVSIDDDEDRIKKYILQDKDIIITTKGLTNRVAIFESNNNTNGDERYIATANFTIIRLDLNIMNPYFLKMFLESKKGQEKLDLIRTGGVLPSISAAKLQEIKVPVPDMETQNRLVAEYKDRIVGIKKLQKQMEKEKEELRKMLEKVFKKE